MEFTEEKKHFHIMDPANEYVICAVGQRQVSSVQWEYQSSKRPILPWLDLA